MSDDLPYERYLRLLGLRPADSPEKLRLHYRKLVKLWHPDRHHHDPDKQQSFEEKLKEINKAYAVLTEYVTQHGALPGTLATTIPLIADPVVPATPVRNSEVDPAPTPAPSPGHFRHRRVLMGMLATTGIIVLGFAFLPVADITSVYRKNAPSPETRHPSPGIGTLALGASMGRVIEQLGPPERTAKGIWYYAGYAVLFVDGHVSAIEATSEDGRLLFLGKPAESAPTALRVGASKESVRVLMGDPEVETTGVWFYGPSRVHFQEGFVSGWHSSPLRPLKTSD